jgi:hypothetical protein
MIDATLQELWSVKDKLAQEHAYDLDNLVSYLNNKYSLNPETRNQTSPNEKPFFPPSSKTAA